MPVEENKLFLCEPDDPNRCQGPGSGGEGQCRYLSCNGIFELGKTEDKNFQNISFCPKHGMHSVAAQGKRRLHDYRLSVWKTRVDEFASSEESKNLRGEVGILRMLLEQIINQATDPNSLIMFSSKISDLVTRIEKTVTACDRLDLRLKNVIDKAGALTFAGEIVRIIQTHIQDPVMIDSIVSQIMDELGKL